MRKNDNTKEMKRKKKKYDHVDSERKSDYCNVS